MLHDVIQKIKELSLPLRFEQKLSSDMEYLLSYHIPGLDRILLFGSCARNTIRITSDIDLLIITSGSLERMMCGEIASVLEEEMDKVHTDVIFYTCEQYEDSKRLFTQQVKREGIVLYENS